MTDLDKLAKSLTMADIDGAFEYVEMLCWPKKKPADG